MCERVSANMAMAIHFNWLSNVGNIIEHVDLLDKVKRTAAET